jgi:hypothetical protein
MNTYLSIVVLVISICVRTTYFIAGAVVAVVAGVALAFAAVWIELECGFEARERAGVDV